MSYIVGKLQSQQLDGKKPLEGETRAQRQGDLMNNFDELFVSPQGKDFASMLRTLTYNFGLN